MGADISTHIIHQYYTSKNFLSRSTLIQNWKSLQDLLQAFSYNLAEVQSVYKPVIGRAKRAPHWGCSIEVLRDIYMGMSVMSQNA